jgi:hypothetical protein
MGISGNVTIKIGVYLREIIFHPHELYAIRLKCLLLNAVYAARILVFSSGA